MSDGYADGDFVPMFGEGKADIISARDWLCEHDIYERGGKMAVIALIADYDALTAELDRLPPQPTEERIRERLVVEIKRLRSVCNERCWECAESDICDKWATYPKRWSDKRIEQVVDGIIHPLVALRVLSSLPTQPTFTLEEVVERMPERVELNAKIGESPLVFTELGQLVRAILTGESTRVR